MPYCIYLRKSRADLEAEAHGEGETLARHERTLTELALLQGHAVSTIYREIVSGESISARPVVQQLLSEVEDGLWEGVYVMEVERLARGDTIDQGIVARAFTYTNTLIITPMKTYDPRSESDLEYFEFGLFMSRREYKTINRRLQRGREVSVLEGKYTGNVAPYGYRRVKLQHDKGWTLEPEPTEAPVVSLVFEWYTSGTSLPDGRHDRIGCAKIARLLNDMGYRSRKGQKWTSSSIINMLHNPTYAGYVVWNRRPCKKTVSDGKVSKSRPHMADYIKARGLHPPLVSEETFRSAQDYLSANPPRPIGIRYTVSNPLAGVVTCAICGRKMVRRPPGSKNPADTLMCREPSCPNISSPLKVVEDRILLLLQEWSYTYSVDYLHDDNIQSYDTQIKALSDTSTQLQKEKQTIQKQLSSLHDLLEQGVYDVQTFLARNTTLREKDKQLSDRLSDLKVQIDHLEQVRATQNDLLPRLRSLLLMYRLLPNPVDKNSLLKSVLENVDYKKTQKTPKGGDPNNFELKIYPRLPK